MTKRYAPKRPLYMFLTGRAGTCKTFTTKVLFEAMIRYYDKQLDSDLLKVKGIIVASIGKVAFNVRGNTTVLKKCGL